MLNEGKLHTVDPMSVKFQKHQVTCKSLDKSFAMSSESFFSCTKSKAKQRTFKEKSGGWTQKSNYWRVKKAGQGIKGFKPSQVFHRLLKHLFLCSSMPPVNSLGEGGIQEDKFSDFNIAYVLVYNKRLINIYIFRICALW